MVKGTQPSSDELREAERRARALAKAAHKAAEQVAAINARRREIIAELLAYGLTQNEIAGLLDLSRQRITQYVNETREVRELVA